jgi:hypothetical protein
MHALVSTQTREIGPTHPQDDMPEGNGREGQAPRDRARRALARVKRNLEGMPEAPCRSAGKQERKPQNNPDRGARPRPDHA